MPSNCLLETSQSHIGCICTAFLHCVFSHVFSNYLPDRMHSHIGYICLTFLHCAFSKLFSNWMAGNMQSYIGYIYLNFLHCAFSNVFFQLTCLRRGIVTLVAFIWLFSTLGFQMSPQTACLVCCKSHWLHLFDFSPLCCFKLVSKWPVREDE